MIMEKELKIFFYINLLREIFPYNTAIFFYFFLTVMNSFILNQFVYY